MDNRQWVVIYLPTNERTTFDSKSEAERYVEQHKVASCEAEWEIVEKG